MTSLLGSPSLISTLSFIVPDPKLPLHRAGHGSDGFLPVVWTTPAEKSSRASHESEGNPVDFVNETKQSRLLPLSYPNVEYESNVSAG